MLRPLRRLPFVAALVCAAPALAQTNHALTGTATQSSLDFGGLPERAIDGNTNGNWSAGSITHTGNLIDSWWQVDLGARRSIGEVRLYNRLDCCWTRLSNFRVSIFDGQTEVFGEDSFVGTGSVAAGAEHSVRPPGGTSGDRVRVAFLMWNNDSNGFLSLAEVEVYDAAVGTSYCGPAFPNSTGTAATIQALGTSFVASPLALRAEGLPPNQFGIFLASQTQGFVNPPGSTGILCLGGTLATFNAPADIRFSGTAGAFELDVDTQAMPTNPPAAIQPGETWSFQAWYRDRNPGVTSNFTDGVAVTFQ